MGPQGAGSWERRLEGYVLGILNPTVLFGTCLLIVRGDCARGKISQHSAGERFRQRQPGRPSHVYKYTQLVAVFQGEICGQLGFFEE